MLRVSRQLADGANEIYIGDNITIKVLKIEPKRINGKTGKKMEASVTLGVEAPPNVKIRRSTFDED
jgi:sRNA-binding carbon storage regulator CsrA